MEEYLKSHGVNKIKKKMVQKVLNLYQQPELVSAARTYNGERIRVGYDFNLTRDSKVLSPTNVRQVVTNSTT